MRKLLPLFKDFGDAAFNLRPDPVVGRLVFLTRTATLAFVLHGEAPSSSAVQRATMEPASLGTATYPTRMRKPRPCPTTVQVTARQRWRTRQQSASS